MASWTTGQKFALGAGVVTAIGLISTVLYEVVKKPKTIPAPPANLPSGDVWAALTPAQQSTLASKLYAWVTSNSCAAVTLTGPSDLMSATDSVASGGNRPAAVDCYQTWYNTTQNAGVVALPASGQGGPGTLDALTFSAIVNG